jgi:hypothetical protein
MTDDKNASFPIRRTYVVKVCGEARPDAPAGRAENLVTGRLADFRSGHELVEAIAKDLERENEAKPA